MVVLMMSDEKFQGRREVSDVSRKKRKRAKALNYKKKIKKNMRAARFELAHPKIPEISF